MVDVSKLRENLALNLKMRRELLHLSQAALAERAGISPGYLGGLETMQSWPSDSTIEQLGKALGVDCSLLFIDPSSDKFHYNIDDIAILLERNQAQLIRELAVYGFRPADKSSPESR